MNQAVTYSGQNVLEYDFSTYSRYWRVNRSTHEATELALILRALRKVVSHIGTNVKPIHWAGMTDSNNKSIIINADEIQGVYPIPYEQMDLFVGHVVREAFASIEWSEWIRDRIQEQVVKSYKDKLDFLSKMFVAAEDIYISYFVNSRIWPLYLNNYWNYLDHINYRDPSLPPTPTSLSNVWKKCILLNEKPDNLHPYYEVPLSILITYTQAIKIASQLSSVGQRRNSRVDIYVRMWEMLYRAISNWEKIDFPDEGVNIPDELGPKKNTEDISDVKEDEIAQEEEEVENTEELDPDLVSKISTILEEGETDLTKNIAIAVEEPTAKDMTTIHTRASATSSVVADSIQVRRLRKIFKKQKALHKKLSQRHVKRYLDQGKLDARRLFRVPIDGKVFKCKITIRPEKAWNITIVSDASASMSGRNTVQRPWDSAEKTFVSLVEAAKGFKNQLDVYGYHEEGDQCVLIKLYHNDTLFTVTPSGRTPSGQAIMAAALMMKERYQKKLIIHITDGAANCGLNIVKSLDYCKNKNIDLITIGCGCNQQTSDFLRTRFPEGQLLLMDDINDLSVGLERLFKTKLLK
ncbi:MAG: vWA domain-containing protein [Spirochaetota bacterium]|nr:vWA domain-containing protein [Spirochaetota bacterium]